ncbi:MAG: hypothetical protein QOH12_569 [Solirubrobacteraceae bacterium]|jgi:hypothetical protein|nr:hypothetical protein [Solirubrobacteraceae bacterium]
MGIDTGSYESDSEGDGSEQPPITSDFIAESIAESVRTGADGEPAKPLVTFHGWVVAGDPVTRLYPDSTFAVWLEIPTVEIVGQLPGRDRPHDDERSVLWVIADARVKTCRVSTADSAASATPPTEEFMRALIWPRPKP